MPARHAVQRSLSCTSFDAHDRARCAILHPKTKNRGACVHLRLSRQISAHNRSFSTLRCLSSGCPNRFASLDAHDSLALPCSRSRTFSYVPTDFEPRFRDLDFRLVTAGGSFSVHTSTHVFGQHLSTRPNTLTARVHIQRIVIEKVWLFRLRKNRPARAFEPSSQSSGSADSEVSNGFPLHPSFRSHANSRW